MNKEENKIVPALRFPEFEKGWEKSELGNKKVSFFVNDKTPKEKLNIDTYVSTENLLSDYGGVKKSNKLPNSGSFTNYKSGDILIANIRPYLKKVWFANKEGTASNDVIVFRAGSSISESFLQYILKSDIFINYVMKGAKGVKMPRGDKSLMKKYPVYFPAPKEQQKIADCLSSLDNLITSETEKLDHLKDHKKGLLQRLFPAEGETKPQFRFKEFENDGDWEDDQLGNVTSYFKGYAFKSKDYQPNGRKIIRVSDMGYDYIKEENKTMHIAEENAKQYKNWELKENDLIIATVGSKPPVYDSLVGRSIVVQFKDKGSLLNQNAVCLRTKKIINQKFLNNQIKRNTYICFIESIIRGNANQGSITLDNLFKFSIGFPKNPKEQQKIANCLSSVDDLIEEQTSKVEVLKAHKKGLMQQLFPNVNELAV